MNISEAINYALNGEAILFAGAGFNYMAKNINGQNFPLGNDLCKRLIEDGNIDVSGEPEKDLEDPSYISERYLMTNTKRDIKEFLKKQFTCQSYTRAQKTVACLPWQRIYTTNYDNLLEKISEDAAILRQSVNPRRGASDIYKATNAIIHINSFIEELNDESLDREFKLTISSYQHRSIPDSDLAISLSNDLKVSRAIIFVGYSLEYDPELQQIFAEQSSLHEKCVFITKDPSRRTRFKMEKFGTVYGEGIDAFAATVKDISRGFVKDSYEHEPYCFKEIKGTKIVPSAKIEGEDVVNLFFKGDIQLEHIFSSLSNLYVIERETVKEISNYLLDGRDEFKSVIVHSDLGNGKSVLIRELEQRLCSSGHVYYLFEATDKLRLDLDYIANQKGHKYIFIEDYNRIIYSKDYARILSLYIRSDIRFIFTVRSSFNDNIYQQLIEKSNIPEQNLMIYDVNKLSKQEIESMYTLLTYHSFWGERAADNASKKYAYLKRMCKKEIKNIVLDLLNSKELSERIEKVINTLFVDESVKEITLLGFISTLINVPLSLNDMVVLLNKQIQSGYLLHNAPIREFFDLRDNAFYLKSALVAQHVLTKYHYNEDVRDLIIRLLPVLDRNSMRYEHLLKMLISHSNLRIVLNQKDKNYRDTINRIYEAAKILEFHKENPFFWLQYAIACMDLGQYERADIYLKNAEAYYKKRSASYRKHYVEEFWQINTQRARYILETLNKYDDINEIYNSFSQAHYMIITSSTKDMFFPLRQTSLYENFYNHYYDRLSDDQQVGYQLMCHEVITVLEKEITKLDKINSTKRASELRRYKGRIEKTVNK